MVVIEAAAMPCAPQIDIAHPSTVHFEFVVAFAVSVVVVVVVAVVVVVVVAAANM